MYGKGFIYDGCFFDIFYINRYLYNGCFGKYLFFLGWYGYVIGVFGC